jgi:hypothetical protein
MDKYDEERGADENNQEGGHGRVRMKVTGEYIDTVEAELKRCRDLQLVELAFDALSRPSCHVERPCVDG